MSVAGTARRVRLICEHQRRSRRRGDPRISMARRCARLALQGIISKEEAEDALTLIIIGKDGKDADTLDGMDGWLKLAKHLLAQATDQEGDLRSLLAAEIGRACRDALARWAPPAELVELARSINAAAGRPFVWPELDRLIQEEVARHIRAQRAARVRHG